MSHRIAVIAGDGAGPEVIAEARKTVDALGLELEWNELPWGTRHYHETGAMMPPDALDVVRAHDAVLLGAVGDPSVPDHVTLWGLLLPLRQGLDLWANLRPARLLEGVPSPLAGGPAVDMLFVRENTEGEYSGVGGRAHQGLAHEVGIETAVFTRGGVERVIRHAFELAETRRGVVTSATKSNASRYGYVLWDEVAEEVAAEHPDVRYERVLVDALAARMVRNPLSLDVVVASNLFGDVLTDIAAELQGGMGMAASASLAPGSDTPGSLRAGARLGARHRRPGDREPDRRDLERLAHARPPRRARGRRNGSWARSRRSAATGSSTRDLGGRQAPARWATRSQRVSEWWREAVFYEIYVRSFADSDGDGVGDLPGIRSRLPYLQRARRRRDLADAVLPVARRRPRLRRGGLRRRRPAVRHARRLRRAARGRARARAPRDRRHRPEPHVERARVVHATTPRVLRLRRDEPNNWPSTFGGSAWTRRAARPVVSPPLRAGAARPRLAQRGRATRVRADPPLLARPRRRRLPHRRRACALQGSRRCATRTSRFRARRSRPTGGRPSTSRRCTRSTGAGAGCSTRTRASGCSSARSFFSDPARSRSTCGPTSCTSRSTSRCCSRSGTPRRCAPRRCDAQLALARSARRPTWVLENHDVTRLPTRYGGGEEGLRRARAARCSCSRSRARRSSTRARSSGSRRSTCPTRCARIPSSSARAARARAATAAASRSRGRTARPASASRAGEPWLPMPADGAASASRRSATSPPRRSRSTARRSRCGRAATASRGGTARPGRSSSSATTSSAS